MSREISILKGQQTRTVKKLGDILKAMDALEESLGDEQSYGNVEPGPWGRAKSRVSGYWRRTG